MSVLIRFYEEVYSCLLKFIFICVLHITELDYSFFKTILLSFFQLSRPIMSKYLIGTLIIKLIEVEMTVRVYIVSTSTGSYQ